MTAKERREALAHNGEGGSVIGHRTTQEAIDIAREAGLVAIFPLPNELMCDVDTEITPKLPNAVIDTIANAAADPEFSYHVVSTLITTSKSGNHHVWYRLDRDIDDQTRNLLQACLGSDPVREVCVWLRLLQRAESPHCSFETLEQAERVMSWREEREEDFLV